MELGSLREQLSEVENHRDLLEREASSCLQILLEWCFYLNFCS